MKHNRPRRKNIKKDYQSKNLCNPFFRRPKKTLNKKFLALIFFGGFCLFIFFLWFFLAAPIWSIKEIKIEGLTRLNKSEIEDKVFNQEEFSTMGIFKQSNIWLFDSKRLKEEILGSYNFSSLEIIKKLPASIIIKISERPYAFIFEQEGKSQYASRDAHVITEEIVSEEDKQKYFILENRGGNNIISDVGKIILPEAYLDFIFNLTDYLKNSQELRVEKYIVDLELNTIKVKFKDGPEVYFNTRNDVYVQIERLILVKKEKIKDNFSNTKYIDLRYGDKIFIN